MAQLRARDSALFSSTISLPLAPRRYSSVGSTGPGTETRPKGGWKQEATPGDDNKERRRRTERMTGGVAWGVGGGWRGSAPAMPDISYNAPGIRLHLYPRKAECCCK